jgi:preprotein translocase subunit SecG
MESNLITYLTIAQMVLSVALVMVLMLQVRGGGLGGIFGQADTVYRTKRGLEKTLFQFTIVLVVLFIIISLLMLAFG